MLVHVPADVTATWSSARRSTTRRGRPSTRSRGCSGSGSPAGRRSTRRRPTAIPARSAFPRAMEDSGDLDFSMSGLKTAVLRHVKAEQAAGREICAARPGGRLPGGDRRRAGHEDDRRGEGRAARHGPAGRRGGREHAPPRPACAPTARPRASACCIPPLELCTDNAAMIACVGAARLARGERTSLDIAADPNLQLPA